MKLNVVSGRDMCEILEKIEFKRIHHAYIAKTSACWQIENLHCCQRPVPASRTLPRHCHLDKD